MTTIKESAANLRKVFKIRGWNAKMVSVRTRYFSLSSAVDVTIRDASVSKAEVKKLTQEHCEHIARDMNGEILRGGNTYTSVVRTAEVREIVAAQYLDVVKAAFAKLGAKNPTYVFAVDGTTDVRLGFDGSHRIRVWLGNSLGCSVSKNEAGLKTVALQIADYCAA